MRKQDPCRTVTWLLISLLAVASCSSCAPRESATETPRSNPPESFQGDFVARLYSVQSESPGVAGWNQIHVSDDWDAGGEVDWDAVYTDLFRREFTRDLDFVWSELPPMEGPRNDYRGRLLPALCVR